MPLAAQTPKPKRQRRLLIAFIVGMVLAVGFPFIVVGGLLAQTNLKQWQHCRGYTQFNPALWNDPTLSAEPTYVRLCMVDDLLAKFLLMGRSQAGVVELLGSPTPQNGFAGYDLVYILGPERRFISIDYEWLGIKLDAAGYVSDAELVTD